jgi:inhibitor of KinA sporulation pathway (predicted exonuclease)
MYYIIFDTEFITTYSKTRPDDIVNIGAICLDNKGKQVDKFEIYIKPVVAKNITKSFKDLTGITEEFFNVDVTPQDALSKFGLWAYNYHPHTLCCWSSSDISLFYKNCTFYHISRLINGCRYFDIQKSYMYFANLKNMPSLQTALINEKLYSEEEIATIDFHKALTDALYTSKLFKYYFRDFKDDVNYNCSGAVYNNVFEYLN